VGTNSAGPSTQNQKKKTNKVDVPDAVAALVHKKTPACGQLNNTILGTEEHENERRFPWIVSRIQPKKTCLILDGIVKVIVRFSGGIDWKTRTFLLRNTD
jgi:hypothetical protein